MFEQLKEWWEGISTREQKLVSVGGGVALLVVIYYLIWSPVASNLAASQQKLTSTEQTLYWVETNIEKLLEEGLIQEQTLGRKQNLSRLISSTAKRNNINISRIQNQNEQVDVWINDVEFTAFLKWVTALKNDTQVNVINVDISQNQVEGMVKINRLSLSY
ncbi:type II secretion system protein M [Psychromonas algicola]|uniref:type II secretion system protein M n=1 Tax=Psychromonas algicola TaxID=2555642 RepID=UPI00141A002D|nr:type II secretion system protein M [Psychromonas sp. RZ5]